MNKRERQVMEEERIKSAVKMQQLGIVILIICAVAWWMWLR